MGFLERIFKQKKPAGASSSVSAGRRPKAKSSSPAQTEAPTKAAANSSPAAEEEIPDYRVGLTGEYDESGLAKRVTLAFDEDAQLEDVETLWVAQLSDTVVLKGKVPSQDILDKMVTVAKSVDGTASVDTSQVEIA